ncbi:hypothetical protein UCDDS831_g08515 [Diplodia seriata]|uniref:Uncharacterized protein n=1 Tax=Diplodia seriata TaxID=420778 RepID=A0A0G2DSR1_9PEZI|nr:hypothetical protein UCDDS831_g08515 [Diplodia seriata]
MVPITKLFTLRDWDHIVIPDGDLLEEQCLRNVPEALRNKAILLELLFTTGFFEDEFKDFGRKVADGPELVLGGKEELKKQ